MRSNLSIKVNVKINVAAILLGIGMLIEILT